MIGFVTAHRVRTVLLAGLAGLVVLSGCATAVPAVTPSASDPSSSPSPSASDPSNSPTPSASTPITSRAIAALMLDHLPAGYSSARPAWVYDDSPKGFVGAELRYRPSEGTDGDLVRVSLWSRDDPMTCGSREHCVELPGANGDRVFLAWELQEPEEDPGLFSVWVNRPGEVVYGLVAGPVLKTDPRSLTTGTTVDLLRAVITDERLRLLTTADVVAAGEQVQRWKKQ